MADKKEQENNAPEADSEKDEIVNQNAEDKTKQPNPDNTIQKKDGDELSSQKNKRCLIIDDDSWNHRIISQYLQKYNFETLSAESGFEGLNIAVNKRPNMIFLDLVLPDIQGDTILEVLKNLDITKEIPIVILSANINVNIIKLANQYGIREFISKPYKEELVIEKVRKIFFDTLIRDAAITVVQKQFATETILRNALNIDSDTAKKLLIKLIGLQILNKTDDDEKPEVAIKTISEIEPILKRL
jgi:CheY-like chemotaxis protein